jgi:hypothetical protein
MGVNRMERSKVGKDIDSWCTRCKLMLAHTIEAVVGSKITRVHCNTCGAQHAYRALPPGEGPAATRPRTSRAATRSTSRPTGSSRATVEDYPRMIQARDRASARRYALTERFHTNDLVSHPSFGLGIVVAEKDGTKIDVLFPNGVKTLLHGR